MESFVVILTVDISFALIGILLHIIGLIILMLNKRRTNQVVILIHLSIGETLLCCNAVFGDIFGFCRFALMHRMHQRATGHEYRHKFMPEFSIAFDRVINYIGYCEVNLLMMLLTLDRLLCVALPIRRYINFEESRTITKLISLTWCTSIVFGIISLFPKNRYQEARISFGAVCVTCLLFIVSYAIIAYKIRVSRNSVCSEENGDKVTRRKSTQKHYLVPGMIVVCFLVFYGIPFAFKLFYPHPHHGKKASSSTVTLFEVLFLLPTPGYIADVVIYILLIKGNRDIIRKKWRMMIQGRVTSQKNGGSRERCSTIMESMTPSS